MPLRRLSSVQATEASQPSKKHPALQNKKLLRFLFVSQLFPLDPNQNPADQKTMQIYADPDPDPQH
jgi:hypothetical protein